MLSTTEVTGLPQYALNAQFSELLCRALRRSHRLSKQLHGYHQEQEFENRDDLVSVLVLCGSARPNGVHPNGKIGFDVVCTDPFRVHQYPNRLHPAARAFLKKQVAGLPAKCSLGEHLEAKGQGGKISNLRLSTTKKGPK